MLDIQYIETQNHKTAYHIFGNGKIDTVIEMGLGAVMGEWWHIAESLAAEHTVLLYERAGIGSSEPSEMTRTPSHIADELMTLLGQLPHEEKLILISHSQGGLYVQQFTRSYPDTVKGLILLDPLSADDNSYKTFFTLEEQKKSGFNKSENLVIMGKLAKWHLGFIIKAFMKKAPPFYYYDFSMDAAAYILSSITKSDMYSAALEEYRLSHDESLIAPLKDKAGFPDIPIALITHTSAFSVKEIMEFGQTGEQFANKVEDFWQSLMKEYLTFSKKSKYVQARNSGHYIHLTEPDLIGTALDWIAQPEHN